MESQGTPGRIQITRATYELLKDEFDCEPRAHPGQGQGRDGDLVPDRPAMRSRAALAGWAICVLTLLVVVTTITLTVINRASIHSLEQINAVEIVLPISYAVLGGLVVAQQPRSALGWLFLAIAFFNAIPGATTQYTAFALITQKGAPYSPWIAWVGWQASTLVYPAGLANVGLLLIPNGRFLSPRWSIVAWAGLAATVFLVAVSVLDPIAIQLPPVGPIANPTGIRGLEGINQGVPGTLGFLVAGPGCPVGRGDQPGHPFPALPR